MSHYKPYPAYKDSGVEWLGRVPEHWDVTRISNHYRLRNGFPFDSAGFSPDGEEADRLIRIRDLSPSETWIYTSEPCPKSARVEDGDVLVGMDGDFNAVLWQAGPAKLNQRVCALRGETELLTKILLYSLPFPLRIINDTAYSTTVKHLSSGEVLGTRIALPPPCELRSIVSHLDRETARIDALVEKKTRFIELLREKRQALITHAVTKGLDPNVKMKESGVEWLGEVPEHWQLKRLRFAATLNPPIRSDLLADPVCEVSFLPMEAIGEDGALNLEQNRPVQDVRNGYSYFEDGDVAFAKVTPCFENGKGALMQGLQYAAGFGTTELTVMRPMQDVTDARHLSYIVQSTQFRTLGAAAMTGAGGLKRVPDEFTRNFLVAFPPRTERELIGDHLDRETARIDALLGKTEHSITLLKERRSALITAAVTGQIDLREAV